MILDTTYILPLTGIDVEVDLLKATVEGRSQLSLDDVKLSLISIFELQAKAAKLGIPSQRVTDAIKVILESFEVISFHRPDIVKLSFNLRKGLPDYIDCVILATAIALKEGLVTEDERIWNVKDEVQASFKTEIHSYKDLTRSP